MLRSLTILPILVLAVSTAPALAQPQQRGPLTPQQQGPAARPPPPALPGLIGRRSDAIPASPDQGNLSPNDALFDAIARGDIAAARDAVARGADLEARNPLGQTPTDAAVDRGRMEIAFFLLSARTVARSPAPPPEPQPAQRRPRTPPPPVVRAPVVSPAAAPRQPRLWAADGGTAQPEIGFLGFNVGRPSGGAPEPAAARRPARGR